MQQMSPKVRWEWIGEGWQMFTRQWQSWALITLVYLLAFAVPIIPLYLLIFAVAIGSMPDPDSGAAPEFPLVLVALYPVFYLVILCMGAWLGAGMYRTAFKQLRGGQISIGDLFSGGPYFLRILGATFLIGIAIMIGGLLCFIPGLIAMSMLFFSIPLIIEGNLGVIDAMKKSVEVTKNDWLMFTLFTLALYFLASAGIYVCLVGALATLPLLFTTHAIAYRDSIGVAGAQEYMPAVPPPPVYGTPAPPPVYADPQPQAQESMPKKFCINCGVEVRAGSKFCPRCGNTLPA